MEEKTQSLQEILKKTQAYNCVECGKCSSVCPIAKLKGKDYPRQILRKALFEAPHLMEDGLIWSCLTCGLCDEFCELDVKFYEFIRVLREESQKRGISGLFPHHGGPHAWMAMMAETDMKQDRLYWVEDHMKIKDKGDVLYFVGCLPYYDVFFDSLKPDTLSIARSMVKILNTLDIEPAVMAGEKCCGHDFLWSGNIEEFKKLAVQNLEAIKVTGAKTIVTACAECYNTLKFRYPEYVGKLDAEVLHISEFLNEKVPDLDLKGPKRIISYHDPCRLGRLSGAYDEPRNVINAIEDIELREMARNRHGAICCGTSGWLLCSKHSKQLQLGRMKEARSTGADLMVTSCPKCQIHFKCALSDSKPDEDARIEIKDLTTLVADCLK